MEETYTDYLGRLWDFSTDPPIHGDSGSLLREGGCAGQPVHTYSACTSWLRDILIVRS